MSPKYTIQAELAGVLATPGWAILLGENDTGLHDLSFYVWIVSDGDRIGLIDTGLPIEAADRAALSATNADFGDDVGFRSVRTLPEILRDRGIRPEDVSFVALTQTVTYHSGGIDADLLPNAVFHLARAGVLEFLVDPPGHPAPEFYFTARSWGSLRTLAIERRLHLVDTAAEIAPGIRFEVTGGHHPGSAGVLVATASGTVGILETAFVDRNVRLQRPIGIAEDAAAARRAMASFAERCARVVAIHDPGNAIEFGGDHE